MDVIVSPTEKQEIAWEALQDGTIRYVVFGGGAGGGKAQTLTSKIYTPTGYKLMGDINVGDFVLGVGGARKVIAIHPQGEKNIYRVIFSDGASGEFTDGHLFDCWPAGRGQERRSVRSLKQIMDSKSDYLIPLCVADFKKRKVLIDPYIIGAMLGDGGLTKHLTFTTADEQLLVELKKRLPKYISIRKTNDIQYSLVQDERNEKGFPVNYLAQAFTKYGLLPIKCSERFIPKDYLYNSKNVRVDVLRGLLDTDGYIDNRGHVSFTSKSRRLAEDVQFLVRSLGGKATLKEATKSCNGVVGQYYCVYIRIKNEHKYFLLQRKKDRARKGDRHVLGRKIVKIERVGKELAQCITVEGGLYLTDDFILTHNSWLGCEWLLYNCYVYPGSKWFVGREKLTDLMQSTFITWTKVCNHHNIPRDDWKLNGQYHYIEFKNGSRIDLLDIKLNPSDPMFEGLGSREYTGGWIEEAGEVDFMAFDVLKSRINRHMNKEFRLPGTMLITCNPNKDWLYSVVYKPWKKRELDSNYCFIQSLYGDNPHTAKEYEESLSDIKNEATKQRLKYGNWEYDDDPAQLMDYDSIRDLFTTKTPEAPHKKSLTIDIARFGPDKAVFMYWEGLQVKEIRVYERSAIDFLQEEAASFCNAKHIPRSNVIADEGGVGGGFIDNFKCKGFVGNRAAIPPLTSAHIKDGKQIVRYEDQVNYANLRTQCYYLLAEYVNNRRIGIDVSAYEEQIIQELEQVREKNIDKDSRLQIIGKEQIKETIGRSPDFADCFVAGTKILTPKGNRNIEDLKVGDKVITPLGITKIGRIICKETDVVYELNSELIGTGNHKLFTKKGLKRLDLHSHNDYNCTYNIFDNLRWKFLKALCIKEKNLGFRQIMERENITTTEQKERCTGVFGKTKLVIKSLKVATSIMLMEIHTIIVSKIYNFIHRLNTLGNIGKIKSLWNMNVCVAKKSLFQKNKTMLCSVPILVSKNIIMPKKHIMKKEPALYVKNPFWLEKMKGLKLVQSLVRHTLDGKIKVYTLTLEEDNVYYANGYLVENCLMMRMYFELPGRGIGSTMPTQRKFTIDRDQFGRATGVIAQEEDWLTVKET